MTKQEILDFLGTFVRQQKSEVNYGTYRATQRKSLLKDGLSTRANSVWKQSQFVVAYMDKTETEPVDSFLNGWSQLTRGIYDQYLILEAPEGVWTVYDKNCENKGNVEFLKTVPQCEAKFGTRNNITQKELLEEDLTKELSYLSALRTKPFMLLAGISGTGKSRIVRKLAQASITEDVQKLYDPKSIENGFKRWELHKPVNFELVQVKPNWHNSLEVVGYKSNIGGPHYEFTPFVEFVARAWKHQDIPFFLCLDEMNLAPVEQYFAEFLSAIESRSIENDEYETDPIIKPFSEFDTRDDNGNVTDKLSDRMIAKLVGKLDTQAKSDLADRFRTKGLTLPKNLFVLGTVNMDETTFSFSRKVLDRAMSIVMNDVEYDKFFKGETDNDMAEFDEAINNLLIDRPIRGLEAEDNGAELVEEYLTAINEKLNNTPFKLGYRAANEALLYVSAAHQFNSSVDVNSALDEFTLMKILSRIEGDKRSIGNLLQDLQQVINESYPASNKKLVQMAETLQDKQFVSYWT